MATNFQLLPADSLTLANFLAWGQGPGIALAAFGWTLDGTVNGTVNWGTIVNRPGDVPGTLPAIATLTFRNAYSTAAVSYVSGDTVTFNGATWICIAATGATSATSNTVPGQDFLTGTQHWQLYPYEIWKSAGSPTIYLKLEYHGNTNGAYFSPVIRVTVATSDDTSANVGGGAGQQATSSQLINTGFAGASGADMGGQTPCYFSGDSTNRFAMMMWETSNVTGFFCVERSLTSSGGYNATPSGAVTPYWSCVWAGSGFLSQAIINTTGTTYVKTTADNAAWTFGIFGTHSQQVESGSLQTMNAAMNLPVYPCFPLVGWVGNPMTAVAGFKLEDAPQAAFYTVQMYGTSRTYYATRNSIFSGFGSQANNGLAMRYD